ncbi:unnamed protein product [Camellia sinensis]
MVMLLWSYFAVIFTDPGSVPPNWRPASDKERGETDPLTEAELGGMSANPVNPRIRYCRKCNQPKPPRCHHCSICEWEVCAENGPSLCVGCQLCGGIELQVFSSFPGDRFAWLRDNEFSRQALAGVNPVNIELLRPTAQAFTPPVSGSSNNQPWNLSIASNPQCPSSIPSAQISQAFSKPAPDVTSQSSSMEVKPSRRTELPEIYSLQLIHLLYQFRVGKTGPPQGYGFNMQYNNTAMLGEYMGSEIEIVDRIVYKNKNQHRRCSYFEYLLKVRRDLRLLQSAHIEEIVSSSFQVIHGTKPKQKVQLLESVAVMTRTYPEDSGERNEFILLQNIASYMLLACGAVYLIS